jgi:hypothetical protein
METAIEAFDMSACRIINVPPADTRAAMPCKQDDVATIYPAIRLRYSRSFLTLFSSD